MKVKDLKLTISPQFDLGETARFTRTLTKGTFRAGGSMAKGFAKAYNKLGKTSMYAQYIMASLRNIYEVLTKSNRTIEKGWNLATGTLRKTSRATGLTEGQISAFTYGFSKAGISTEDSTGLLEGFALQQRINDPYNTDPANLANRAWSALMELKGMDPVRDRIERNAMAQEFFNMDAEKGGLIDTTLNNMPTIRGGIGEFYKTFKNPEKITSASREASGFADKELNAIVKHNIQLLLKGYSKKTLETPHDEKQAFRDEELAELDHKDYTRDNVKRAIQQYLSVQSGITSMTKTLSNKISELLERWGGVDKVVDRVVNGFERLVKQVDKLATAIEWLVNSIRGDRVANFSRPELIEGVSLKEIISSDKDLQKSTGDLLKDHPGLADYMTQSFSGVKSLNFDDLLRAEMRYVGQWRKAKKVKAERIAILNSLRGDVSLKDFIKKIQDDEKTLYESQRDVEKLWREKYKKASPELKKQMDEENTRALKEQNDWRIAEGKRLEDAKNKPPTSVNQDEIVQTS